MDRNRPRFPHYGYLVPCVGLCLYGLIEIGSWMAGNSLVARSSSDEGTMALCVGVCVISIGFYPIALAMNWKQAAAALGLVTALVAGTSLFFNWIPVVIACLFFLIGLGAVWSVRQIRPEQPAEKNAEEAATAHRISPPAQAAADSTTLSPQPQLGSANTDADELSRLKTEFLATMSHEIRTPMNGVIGMTNLLLETELTAEQRDFVNTIRTSGDTLLSIINEILDFSKIEAGRMELEYRPFDLAQCVEEAIDLFTVPAAAKNIEMAYFIEAKTPRFVLGDSSRVRQILVNLLKNAVKFTPSGSITVEVRPANDPDGSSEGKGRLDIRVTDTGIGIPAERLGLLFKPFSQVDSSNTRKYGGTGLGLAICDRLCRLMGGNIEVTSKTDQGSSFRFSIQVTEVNSEASSQRVLAPIPAGGPVLVVDDLPVNRSMLKACLDAWQLSSLIAADATEALSLTASGPLAAAVIDHDLAGTSSLRLVAELRAARPTLPIICLTAAGDGRRRIDSLDSLVFQLPKPIKPQALYDAVRHAIIGASSMGSSPSMIGGVAIRLAESIPLDILLVEDNPVNQKIALRFLQRLGYRADAVANGLEAVEAVRKRDYKLLLMDVQMPEMDGFTAAREIRSTIAKDRQPVIVALTANAMQGDRERCLDAGMNDYITKPVKIDEIEQVIRRFFALKSTGN